VATWAGGGTSGVQAAYSVSGGIYTYEIAIPLWTNWVTMNQKKAIGSGDVVYVYSVMESGLETTHGTNMTYYTNPSFAYENGFHQAAALTLTGALAGDANNDNKVDVSDLGILAANYGATAGATWSMGDFNDDGKVDVSDLGILAANYGAGTGTALDINADAKAFGLTAESEKAESPAVSDLGCTSAGLPLIAGLLLAGLMLVKWNE
jgi:hypothetical protein